MVIGDLLKEGIKTLTSAGIENPRLDAEVLLAHLLKQERLYLLMHRSDEITEPLADSFRRLIERRVGHEPVAYLTGCREFMSLPFFVAPGVLIPRPDTETLAELVLAEYQNVHNLRILDLCTGSGAIAVSLAYYLPDCRVTALDVSPVCVKTAEKNAAANGVSPRVEIIERDVLQLNSLPDLYDCVVSNPPYIPAGNLEELMSDVRCYEPRTALDGGEDGLLFYRHIISTANKLLKPGGLLALEVGHDQAEAVAALIEKTGFFEKINFRRDLAGICRVVCGYLKA